MLSNWDYIILNAIIVITIILGLYYFLEFIDYLLEKCQRKKIIPIAQQVILENGITCNNNEITTNQCNILTISPVYLP